MPIVDVEKLKAKIESNTIGIGGIKTGVQKKKRHVEVTTAMGQQNVFVGICPVEMAGKVESKHVVIIP